MTTVLFAEFAFIRLSPQEAREFCQQAERCEFVDPIYGGSVIAWRKPNGHIYVESITVSKDRLAQ